MGYAKLFSSITESSLWSESKDARLLFVTMLARADATGFVEAALPGIARVANLTLEETQAAMTALEGPDPHSKDLGENPENEGRRVIKVPNGWMLVNYEAYRERRSDQERREYMREYMRKRRSGKQPVNPIANGKPESNHGKPPLAQAEAEAEAEAEADPSTLTGTAGADRGKRAAKKASPKPESSADPRFTEVKDGYIAAHDEIFPSEIGGYKFKGGRDGKALSDFLKTTKPEAEARQIVGQMRAALLRAKADRFATACKKASTLHGFCENWSTIWVELKQPLVTKSAADLRYEANQGEMHSRRQPSARAVTEEQVNAMGDQLRPMREGETLQEWLAATNSESPTS